jgi:hypothetical protein
LELIGQDWALERLALILSHLHLLMLLKETSLSFIVLPKTPWSSSICHLGTCPECRSWAPSWVYWTSTWNLRSSPKLDCTTKSLGEF